MAMLLVCWPGGSFAQTWKRLGPEGGQVISLATADSGEIFLGTADGHVFASADGGTSWAVRGHVGQRWDAVVQALVADSAEPKKMFAAVWNQDPAAGGGVYWSTDAGATWQQRGLEGEAVRALAQWRRDSKVLVAGTKSGVFRSPDGGETWKRISPEGDEELKNLDSVAIDPQDLNVIYAGTYHLPWKTTDGGQHWTAIGAGMIDDSDIMSLAIDRSNPVKIFASACSGIYRSENGGEQWTKLQGIPYASRRTQQILQDPENLGVWFAGTTEGLWKSADGGENWERQTERDVAVNAIAFANREARLLVGTDEGVRASANGGKSFIASEAGFSHRVLSGFAVAEEDRDHVLVVEESGSGKILESKNGGKNWRETKAPKGAAVRVFVIGDLWIASLRGGGAAYSDSKGQRWRDLRFLARTAVRKQPVSGKRTAALADRLVKPEVLAVTAVDETLLLATDEGLWGGRIREGVVWRMGEQSIGGRVQDVWSDGKRIFATTGSAVFESGDVGKRWASLGVPDGAGNLLWLRTDATQSMRVLLGTQSGIFAGDPSVAGSHLWRLAQAGLPAIATEPALLLDGLWVVPASNGAVYVSRDEGKDWERLPNESVGAAVDVREAGPGRIYVLTKSDGLQKVVLVPETARNSQIGTGSSSSLVKLYKERR